VIYDQRETFGRYLFAVNVQREKTQIVLAEIIRFRCYGAEKFRVFRSSEKELFWDGSQQGVFFGKRLRSAKNRERLQFDSGQI